MVTSPVVVDGRVSREKLDELLGLGAEHTELDFKRSLNLTDSAHRLGLVKDLIGNPYARRRQRARSILAFGGDGENANCRPSCPWLESAQWFQGIGARWQGCQVVDSCYERKK